MFYSKSVLFQVNFNSTKSVEDKVKNLIIDLIHFKRKLDVFNFYSLLSIGIDWIIKFMEFKDSFQSFEVNFRA